MKKGRCQTSLIIYAVGGVYLIVNGDSLTNTALSRFTSESIDDWKVSVMIFGYNPIAIIGTNRALMI